MKNRKQHTSLLTRTEVQSLAKHLDILSLFEFSNVVNSSYDLQFILSTVLRTLMGKFVVSRGIVFLSDKTTDYTVVCVKGIPDSTIGFSVAISSPPRTVLSIDTARRKRSPWYQFLRRYHQKIAIPLWINEKCIGVVTLGERYGKKKSFTRVERELMLALANLSASAIEKARMITELDALNKTLGRRVQELNTLFDVSKEFNIGLDAQRVLRLLTLSLLGQMGVQQYAICFSTKGTMHFVENKGIDGEQMLGVLNKLSALDTPVVVTEMLQQRRQRLDAAELLKMGIRALVPMRVQNRTLGLICLGKSVRGDTYSQEELEFLFSLASLATIAIENAHLLETALEKQRIEGELHIARDIQQALLPARLPSESVFECAAINIPSTDVGGDYYDVIRLTDTEYLFAIADVAGKGIPASLLMANVQAALRALAPYCTSTSTTVMRINDVVCSNIRGGNKFITFFTGILNTKTLELFYTNAGHNPPLLVRSNGAILHLEEGGLILGVFPNSTYEEKNVKLFRGDVLVLYTDGISEAMNAREEEFTEEHLEELLKNVRHLSAKEILGAIQTAVARHVQKHPQSDDITLLVVKVR